MWIGSSHTPVGQCGDDFTCAVWGVVAPCSLCFPLWCLRVFAPPDSRREEAIWPQWQQWLRRPHQSPRPGAAESFPGWDPNWGPGTRLHPFPGNGLWDWSRCWAAAMTALLSFRGFWNPSLFKNESLLSSQKCVWLDSTTLVHILS